MSISITQILAAAEPPTATNLLVTGFLFVVAILTLLAFLTYLSGKYFSTRTEPAAVTTNTARRAADVIKEKAEHDGQIAAVVTAAVYIALGSRRVRVRSIRKSSSPGWAQEGRRQIFSSHRLR